jgi:hypothetical protein
LKTSGFLRGERSCGDAPDADPYNVPQNKLGGKSMEQRAGAETRPYGMGKTYNPSVSRTLDSSPLHKGAVFGGTGFRALYKEQRHKTGGRRDPPLRTGGKSDFFARQLISSADSTVCTASEGLRARIAKDPFPNPLSISDDLRGSARSHRCSR